MRRRMILAIAVLLTLSSAPRPAAADHFPAELAFLQQLDRTSTDNACRDPESKQPAVCVTLQDRSTGQRYRLVYRDGSLVSAWRERGESRGFVLIWPRLPNCRYELCV